MIASDALHDDPVHFTQRAYRAILAALSYPGRITPLAEHIDAPPALGSALAAAAITLFDREVTVWSDDADASGWLGATTGCRIVSEPQRAQYAVIRDPAHPLPLAQWCAGTAEDPEDGATLLIRCTALTPRGGVTLRGPGIASTIALDVVGVPPAFWTQWNANAARFPLGVDCLFFDDRNVAGLPRTIRSEMS